MKIKIDDSYIDWLKTWDAPDAPEITEESLTAYVNEVLANHRASWEDWEED